jgi:hypothetical protein
MSSPTPGNAEASAPAVTGDCFDDMHDSQRDLERYSASLPLKLSVAITQSFEAADAAALRFQRRHQRLLKVTALAGTFAVVLTIVGLALHLRVEAGPWKLVLLMAETGAALWAGWAAYVGFKGEYKEQWLLHRHQAELLRLLRYRFLIRPGIWKRESDDHAVQWIERELAEIKGVGTRGLETAVTGPSPHGITRDLQATLSRQEISHLVQYYLEKRLGPQKEYFANRAQSNEFKDRIRVLLPWFFLFSVTAVIVKFAFEIPSLLVPGVSPHLDHSARALLERLAGGTEFAAVYIFAMAAALLPAFAAGIRLRLSAGEFARNKSRFRAAHNALVNIEESLLGNTLTAISNERQRETVPFILAEEDDFTATSALAQILGVRAAADESYEPTVEQAGIAAVLTDLAWCEHVLDAEHREWLRLMHDTEWFG